MRSEVHDDLFQLDEFAKFFLSHTCVDSSVELQNNEGKKKSEQEIRMSIGAPAAVEASTSVPLTRQRCQFRIAPPQRRVVCRSQQVPRLLFVLVAQDEACIKPSDFSHRDEDFRSNEELRQKRKRLRVEEDKKTNNPSSSNNPATIVRKNPGDGGNRIWMKVQVYEDTTLREIVETLLFDEYCTQLLLHRPPPPAQSDKKELSPAEAAETGGKPHPPKINAAKQLPMLAEIFHVYPADDKKPTRDSLGKLNLSYPVVDAKVDLVTIAELADPKSKEFRGGDMLCVCGVPQSAPPKEDSKV